jgi:O-antigen biosynthesis protein
MRSITRALRRKFKTFAAIWRLEGGRAAMLMGLASARNSFSYWMGRATVGLRLHLRPPPDVVEASDVPPSRRLITVVVPVYNTPPAVLRECLDSVLAQSHPLWELCVCDDCSTDPATVETLAAYRGSDVRIRIVRAERNLGIAGATNLAAEQASGEFLAMLDHDDTLHPQALAEIAAAVDATPDIDLLYTDEDKIAADGSFCEPYYKPDWSPEHLQSVMYVLHCLTIRKALFWTLGGMRPEMDGAQDYDIALRASLVARRIHHVPRVLYHWRQIPGSAAADVNAKPAGLLAAKRALGEHAAHLDQGAAVVEGLLPGTFRLRRSLAHQPPVTLVVLTADPLVEVEGRGRLRLLAHFMRSVAEKSTYPAYRILVVDDGEMSDDTAESLEALHARRVSFVDPRRAVHGFNFARKVNFALGEVETDLMILLNDDLEVISSGWIEALLEPLMEPEVGVVGGRLLYPDGRVQHAGMVLGVGGGAGHAFYGLPGDQVGYCAFTHVMRNYSAVTGAVLATRRSVIDETGPFDEALARDYNDVDFCLRARGAGYRIVYTPFAELLHLEGATLRRSIQDPAEVALFTERWAGALENDPFYNPNLPRDRADYAV